MPWGSIFFVLAHAEGIDRAHPLGKKRMVEGFFPTHSLVLPFLEASLDKITGPVGDGRVESHRFRIDTTDELELTRSRPWSISMNHFIVNQAN